MKPLDQLEPRIAINATNTPGDSLCLFKITAPGSYYLTGNIDGVANKNAIMIYSGNVSIDLNGFSLKGVYGSYYGIRFPDSGTAYPNISIRNGCVHNWGIGGIDFFGTGLGVIIQDIRVWNCAGIGIRGHNSSIIRNCYAYSNDGEGIAGGSNSIIEGCISFQNTLSGFYVAAGGIVRNCSAKSNGGAGIEGLNGSTILDCHVISNMAEGISLPQGGVVMRCTAQSNTLAGIDLNAAGRVSDNTCISNVGDGIAVNVGVLVSGNHCSGNGAGFGVGAGVHAVGQDNRIEGNNTVNNDRGVHVEWAGNLITSNSASGNSSGNFSIVAGNRYGPVVDITAGGSVAMSGNSAASTLTSTDPAANFAH